MTYRKSDGPFGMLRKKTAMDLEWEGAGHPPMPWRREIGVSGPRAPEGVPSDPRRGEESLAALDRLGRA